MSSKTNTNGGSLKNPRVSLTRIDMGDMLNSSPDIPLGHSPLPLGRPLLMPIEKIALDIDIQKELEFQQRNLDSSNITRFKLMSKEQALWILHTEFSIAQSPQSKHNREELVWSFKKAQKEEDMALAGPGNRSLADTPSKSNSSQSTHNNQIMKNFRLTPSTPKNQTSAIKSNQTLQSVNQMKNLKNISWRIKHYNILYRNMKKRKIKR